MISRGVWEDLLGGSGEGERGGRDAWSSDAVSVSLVLVVVVERGGRDAGSSRAVSFSVVVVVLVLVRLLVIVLVLVLVLPVPSWRASCGRREIMFPEGLPGT